MTGAALAQVIPVVGSLVIARQYAPAEFGVFSAWLSVVLFLGVVLTVRFETAFAIVEDGEPRRLAVLSALTTSVLVASAVGILYGVAAALSSAIAERLPLVMAVLLPLAALAVASAQIWQSWAAAEGRYRELSGMRIAQASAVTVGQIAIGQASPRAESLALAHIAGVLLGVLLSIYLLPPGRFPRGQSTRILVGFWKQYRRFPMFSLPADAINTAAAQLPVLLVAARFGADIAGLLAMTMRVMGAPIGLLGKAVLDVFKRYAATSYRERGECRADYIRTFRALAIASFGFAVVLVAASEPFFAKAFGERWRDAGTIAVWLVPLFALRFIASPLSYMAYIADKQHVDLMRQIALFMMTVITLGLPQHYDVALQSYSAGYSLLYVVYLMMSYRFSLGGRR